MPNNVQQGRDFQLSPSEEKALALCIYIAREVRRGVLPEDIQSTMSKRGYNADHETTISRLFYYTLRNLEKFSAAVVFNGLIGQGFGGHFSQCIIDEAQIRTARHFIFNVYTKIFSDMRCRIDEPECPDFFKNRSYIPTDDESAKRVIWINDNADHLFRVWSLLSDHQSKSVFLELLRYSILGPKHVRLAKDSPYYWNLHEQMTKEISLDGLREREFPEIVNKHVRIAKIQCQGKTISFLGCLGCIFPTFYMDQYFIDRETVRIRPEKGDYVVDAGSFVGETAIRFSIAVGQSGRIYCFEPVHEHIKIIEKNITINNLDNIIILPYGLSNIGHEAPPVVAGSVIMPEGCNAAFSVAHNGGLTNIPLATLDDFVQKGILERVDYIKMDIEGSEVNALHGAENTIRRFKPKLAICVYHDQDHIYQIPEWIDNLGLGYKLYMDCFHHAGGEQVIFATTDPLAPLS